MIGFCDLNYAVKALFLVATFVAVCFNICLLPRTFQSQKPIQIVVVTFCFLLGGMMLIMFAVHVKSFHPSWSISPIAESMAALPIIFPIMLLIIIITALFMIMVKQVQMEKNSISRSSVKESLDNLNTGLCFADQKGMVMLINYRMNNLSHTIFGRDVQNANSFWEYLCEGEVQPDVTRLSMGETPSFRLPDQSVWTFRVSVIDSMTQLTAAETTELNRLTEELKKKNAELSAMNYRLRKYGESVDELTREKERLETKTRIHRDLGQTLLLTRCYLRGENDDSKELLRILKRDIEMLRTESEIPKNDDPLNMIMKAADSAGMKVDITGLMPENEEVGKLFFEGMAEALTNAVRHADAKTLQVNFFEDDETYSVCFTNDGNQPQIEIVEGGGLSSLREKIERIGGAMEVLYQSEFVLKLTVPKKGRDNL